MIELGRERRQTYFTSNRKTLLRERERKEEISMSVSVLGEHGYG